MEPRPIPPSREFTDGSTAIVRGALDAGCNFFAGYPITPASPILMMMMREMPRVGGIAVQGEDEIASIGMCLGAVMAGARALTATSGPGLSLYSENLGLAIMGEVPLVVVDVQARLLPSMNRRRCTNHNLCYPPRRSGRGLRSKHRMRSIPLEDLCFPSLEEAVQHLPRCPTSSATC